MALPSFNLTSKSEFRGVTDKSWTKYQEYPAQFRQILENLNWGEEISTQPIPHEEATQVRLAWYNLRRFVQRSKDIHHYFDLRADHISCKIQLQADRITAVVIWQCATPQITNRDLGIQRMELTPPSRIPLNPPAVGNFGLQPPGFSSPQEFDESLNPESNYNKEREDRDRRMGIAIKTSKDREAACQWKLEREAFGGIGLPYEEALEALKKTQPDVYAHVLTLTKEDMKDFKEYINQVNQSRTNFEVNSENKFRTEMAPNSRLDAVKRLDQAISDFKEKE